MTDVEMKQLQKVLSEVRPYVIVCGSFATGKNNRWSDIDMYIKRRPQDELDEDWYNEVEEHYIDKVLEVFESNGLEWDSIVAGYIHTNTLPVQLEAASYFKIHKDTEIKIIDVFGVKMESGADNKDVRFDDAIDYVHT